MKAKAYLCALSLLTVLSLGQIGGIALSQEFPEKREDIKIDRINMKSDLPRWDAALHNVGNIRTAVLNRGEFVMGSWIQEEGVLIDFEYPRGSHRNYIWWGELWIGGIVGRDTLVSTGTMGRGYALHSEFNPDAGIEGEIEFRSILKSSPYWHRDAISEQDFLCKYADTLTDPEIIGIDDTENRPVNHMPLNICVHQSSFMWSTEFIDDFILYDFTVENIGHYPIKEMFVGLYLDPITYFSGDTTAYMIEGHNLTGFRRTFDLPPGYCRLQDSLNLFWSADDDGRPNQSGQWDYVSQRSVIGLMLLRPNFDDKLVNYNWWNHSPDMPEYEWGPRRHPTENDPWRDIGWNLGYPNSDVNRYYVLSHPEFDYNQMLTAINHTGEGFLPPPAPRIAEDIADGALNMYLVSFGPFDLAPGDSFPFTFALVAGENFHVNPRDYEYYFDPYNPKAYYDKLDFSDLAENSRWARAVFDNPGVDTDGDGYSGEFCWRYTWRDTTINDPSDSFAVDSVRYYYTGDTIPDFKAMTPPPPPVVRVEPSYGKVIIRWNGQETENTPDYFSGEVDFEGYRVYFGEDNRLTDFVLLAGYDIDDYKVFQFDTDLRMWRRVSNSAKHDSLKQIHGDDFDANNYYDEFHYFLDPHNGNIYYFSRQDWNQSDMSNPLGIHKVYPDASRDDITDVTLEGWRRYYEYEYVIDNLQPSKPYYFAVTAFDYGAFQYDIGQLETSPQTNAVKAYPLPSSETVEEKGLEVIVYPNPYRIDGGYARAGYENRDRTKSAVWSRRVHFANLPKICTIRIYTIDGDLVREIKHYRPDGGPDSQHEEWNVVSRNTQAVVTGIYIWHVRSEMGDQMGKLVIIK